MLDARAVRALRWNPVVGFIIVFPSLATLGLLALRMPPVTAFHWKLKVGTASVVASVVSALGGAASTSGNTVHLDTRSVEIIDECTGLHATILLLAFILAFPRSMRRKLAALGLAVVAVAALNVFRLVTLCFLLDRFPRAAGFLHDYLWQVVWAGALVAFALIFTRTGRHEPIGEG